MSRFLLGQERSFTEYFTQHGAATFTVRAGSALTEVKPDF